MEVFDSNKAWVFQPDDTYLELNTEEDVLRKPFWRVAQKMQG